MNFVVIVLLFRAVLVFFLMLIFSHFEELGTPVSVAFKFWLGLLKLLNK